MAERPLAVSDLLCFTTFYAKRFVAKYVKDMINDFYSSAAVTATKERLMADLAALDLEDIALPRVPSHRDSAQRMRVEIDDIFGLLKFCDLNKLDMRLHPAPAPRTAPAPRAAAANED